MGKIMAKILRQDAVEFGRNNPCCLDVGHDLDQDQGQDFFAGYFPHNTTTRHMHAAGRRVVWSTEEQNYSKLPCLSEQSKTISFNVLLLCAPHNTTTNRTFTTTKFPESVATLKLAIQEEFQVPVYDQKLSFGSTVMADGESLDFYRLKDGDQITLEYTTTVDVECAFHLMSLLRNALEFVKNEQCQLASGKISPEFSKMISDTLHVKDIDQCIKQLMFSVEKLLANSDFILKNGGLDVIMHIASLVIAETNMGQYMPS